MAPFGGWSPIGSSSAEGTPAAGRHARVPPLNGHSAAGTDRLRGLNSLGLGWTALATSWPPVLVSRGLAMAGCWVILVAMLLHARHVILDAEGKLPARAPKPERKPATAPPKRAAATASPAPSLPGSRPSRRSVWFREAAAEPRGSARGKAGFQRLDCGQRAAPGSGPRLPALHRHRSLFRHFQRLGHAEQCQQFRSRERIGRSQAEQGGQEGPATASGSDASPARGRRVRMRGAWSVNREPWKVKTQP